MDSAKRLRACAETMRRFKAATIDAHELEAAADEIERLRKCLHDTRHEICLGPVDDTLWHTVMPACTSVDNITLTLDDGWDYDEWLKSNAHSAEGQDGE